MRTLAVVNQKGGCGKTTVSINLASSLAIKGNRTLLIDMDSQSHCAVGLAVPEEQIEQSIYDILVSHSRNEPLRLSEILWKISDNFELAPASIDLAAFEQQMSGVVDSKKCLAKVLKTVKKDYDYVIIDCPPAVGLLTFNAIKAASDVIVPVETGYFSLHGLSKQLSTLNVLCEKCGQDVNVMVLASMYDIRTKMGREILSELRKHFSDKMFKTIINFNTKLKEAASLGQPISEYEPASKGSKDFQDLAEELISTDTKVHRIEAVEALQSKLEKISISADELLSSVEKTNTDSVTEADGSEYFEDDNILKTAVKEVVAEMEAESTTDVAAEISAETKQKPVPENEAKTIDEKIADFYGVRQVEEAVVFSSLYPRAEKVMLAGDFNDWKPEECQMKKVAEKGIWQIKLPLAKGKYRYRLVVDGHWQQDPYNEHTEMNPFGECNSVLDVH